MKLVVEKIYCFYCLTFPLRGKVGISGNVEQRRASIEQELRYKFGENIRVRCILKMPIITSAYTFEQSLHQALDKLPYWRCNTMQGTNGWTEWRWSPNWFCAIMAYFIFLAMDSNCRVLALVATIIVPIPLDFMLFVLILAIFEYILAAGIVYFLYNILT